jgi:hypothetical protein
MSRGKQVTFVNALEQPILVGSLFVNSNARSIGILVFFRLVILFTKRRNAIGSDNNVGHENGCPSRPCIRRFLGFTKMSRYKKRQYGQNSHGRRRQTQSLSNQSVLRLQ